MAGYLLQLAKYEYDSEHKLVFTHANRNLTIDMTDHEDDPDAPDADMTTLLTSEQIRAAGEAGLAMAQALARTVRMHEAYPTLPRWWCPAPC